ncbi:MAG: alpha-galactosidase [Candidatus Phosphoribacter sp.]
MTAGGAAATNHVHLRRGGTSVLVRLDDRQLPSIMHWGPDLGQLTEDALMAFGPALTPPYVDSAISSQAAVAVLPQHSSGWLGRPGLLGSRDGRHWSVAFDEVVHSINVAGDSSWPDGRDGSIRLCSTGIDRPSQLRVSTEMQLHPSGVLRVRASVTNLGDATYEVLHLEPALPVPAEAGELLDMAGRHTHERTPQRRPFDIGRWTRESWGGRPGHDSATILFAGSPGFAFRRGRVWGVHVADSGNQVFAAEHTSTGWKVLRGGELLLPGEGTLREGESYTSPWLVASWGEGIDELSHRVHRMLRARPTHPRRARPVLLNTWEAAYFDHDLGPLLALAERAAAIGIERFVLDDGWFRGRRDDRAGLGDWFVDETVWPHGLHPLVDRVHALGMEFGLWFEPEMISLDSDLARSHPEWIFQTEHGPGIASRHQHVLDLAHPAAYEHILERISSLVQEYRIAFLKWDHNRALVDAGHWPDFRPGVHAHTQAVYRMMAQLKQRHPGLELESCCGGGGRLDLGIVEHADRVWVSDCIDAHERQRMVRWTGVLLPPELLGTHVGSGSDHTTGRLHELDFRAGTAIWGHLGVEWDLSRASEAELSDLSAWIAFHKRMRGLLHSGDVVHADLPNPALLLEGVVATDGSEAIYRLVATDLTLSWPPGRVTLPGLDPDRAYHVRVRAPGDGPAQGLHRPGWAEHGVSLTGRVLGEIGIQAPLLNPDQLVLIHAGVPLSSTFVHPPSSVGKGLDVTPTA